VVRYDERAVGAEDVSALRQKRPSCSLPESSNQAGESLEAIRLAATGWRPWDTGLS